MDTCEVSIGLGGLPTRARGPWQRDPWHDSPRRLSPLSRLQSAGWSRKCPHNTVEVARLVGMTEKRVRKWTTRFLKRRLEGLRLFDSNCRGDRAEPDQGDVAQLSLLHGERHERPFQCVFSEFFLIVSRSTAEASVDTRSSAAIESRFYRVH
jgi:hypothetical protein